MEAECEKRAARLGARLAHPRSHLRQLRGLPRPSGPLQEGPVPSWVASACPSLGSLQVTSGDGCARLRGQDHRRHELAGAMGHPCPWRLTLPQREAQGGPER